MNVINEIPDIVFEKHVVAFIDILGFKRFIKEAEQTGTKESKQFKLLLDVVSQNHAFKNELEHNIYLPEEMGLECRQISDSFIITAPCSKTTDKLPTLIAVSIKAIQIYQALLSIGLGVRGGIAVGNLFVKDKNIFGSAFTDAYETESVKAIYPRILLHQSAVTELNELQQYKYRRDSLFAKLDDVIFLDSFFDLTLVSTNSEDIVTKLKAFKECIEINLKNSLELKIRNKWSWVALHFNAHLDYYPLDVAKIKIESIFPIQLDYLNPSDPYWMSI